MLPMATLHISVCHWDFFVLISLVIYLLTIYTLQSCIKVALDFVSPENVQECIRLTDEFRLLPKDHRAKEDKLEVPPLLYFQFIWVTSTFKPYMDLFMLSDSIISEHIYRNIDFSSAKLISLSS